MILAERITAYLRCVRRQVTERGDSGQVTAFTAGVLLGLWLFAGIVVDGGLALAAKAHALDIAQEAARTGAQQLDVAGLRGADTIRLRQQAAAEKARAYVTGKGASGTVTVKGADVVVHVTNRQHAQILQLVGVRTMTLTAHATAHAERVTR
ncbi:pilus assembly protein TadG-related protein [Streptomyces sp. NPDC050095]|uniref:pilus assembly protein TadG-related protein n=1 Tax=unclassified Streptomyces TaxID=2593676 RepID=UPI00343B36B9